MHLRTVEAAALHRQSGREFTDRRVEGIHAHRTLNRDHRCGQVACRTPIARDGQCVNVVFVGADVEFVQVNERTVIGAGIQRARSVGREFRPDSVRQRINRPQRRIAIEQGMRLGGVGRARTTRAPQQDFDKIGLGGKLHEKRLDGCVIELHLRHRHRRPLAGAHVKPLATRLPDRACPRGGHRVESFDRRLSHRLLSTVIAFCKLQRKRAHRRRWRESPLAHLVAGPLAETREKLGATDGKRALHRLFLANTLGIRKEQFAQRIPAEALLDELNHPTPLRVRLRAVDRFAWSNERPVNLIKIEERVRLPRSREHLAVVECARRVLERDRDRLSEPVRNAILRHRKRDGVRVFVTQHRKRIEQPEVLCLRALLGNLDGDGRPGAHRDGVNARKPGDANAETAVIGHHINERLL